MKRHEATGAALEPYSPEAPHTYAFGHFAALAALAHRPEAVTAVVAHRSLAPRWRAALELAAAAAGQEVRWDDATVTRLRRHEQVLCLAQVVKSGEVVRQAADHVVLVAPSHAGNVGSAMRSLVAFGVEDVVLVAPRVDAWGPHVVRASVGMRLALRCQVVDSVAAYLAGGGSGGGRHHYRFAPGEGTELRDARFRHPATLWFGPEWSGGLTELEPPPSAAPVRIRTRPQVESLNLAVAVSLAAYHAAGDAQAGRL